MGGQCLLDRTLTDTWKLVPWAAGTESVRDAWLSGVETNPVFGSELVHVVASKRWTTWKPIVSSRFAHAKRRRTTAYLTNYGANEKLTENVEISH